LLRESGQCSGSTKHAGDANGNDRDENDHVHDTVEPAEACI
jgi:hypothetical protein